MRNYKVLSTLDTLEDRFDYLVLGGEIGYATFGYDRLFNQSFYRSKEWRDVRNFVITRDNGSDLGLEDFPISGPPHVHHMNPLTIDDIVVESDNLINPDFLICVSQRTHNAIHYGDSSLLPKDVVARMPGDTRLW